MIRTSNMNTENNIAIVCITDNGKNLEEVERRENLFCKKEK